MADVRDQQAVHGADRTQYTIHRTSRSPSEGTTARQLSQKDVRSPPGVGSHVTVNDNQTTASRAKPLDADKQTQAGQLGSPSSSSKSKPTSESSSVRQGHKGNIYTIHDRQRWKSKAAVLPLASTDDGPGGRERVQGAPPASAFISQQQGSSKTAVGAHKHSGEEAAQPSSKARQSSIPVKSNARKEKDWQRNSSSSKDVTDRPTSPLRAVSPVPYKVLSVSPAPKSQQANLSNASETKLEQVEKHGRIAQLNFPAIVGHKQPGDGPLELWASQNPSHWMTKDRRLHDTQLQNVEPLRSVEDSEGGGVVLEGEGPGGRVLKMVSAWDGGSSEPSCAAKDNSTPHHVMDISGGYNEDSFEEVTDAASDLTSTDSREEEEEEEEEEIFKRSDLGISSSQTPPMKNASPLLVHDAGRRKKQEEGEEKKGYRLTSTPLNSSDIDRLSQVQSTPVTPFSTNSAPFHKVGPTRVINVAPHQLSGTEYDVRHGEAMLPRGQLKLDVELTEVQPPASGVGPGEETVKGNARGTVGLSPVRALSDVMHETSLSGSSQHQSTDVTVAPRGETVKWNAGGTAREETVGLSPIRVLPDVTLESESDQFFSQHLSTDVTVAPIEEFQRDKQPAPILTAKTRLTSEGASPLSPLLSPHLLSSLLLTEPLDRSGPSTPCLQTSCKSLAILSVLTKGKRSQPLPPYPKPAGGKALASPCPEYGVKQPLVDEVVRAQRGWGGKERQVVEESSDCPQGQEAEGREQVGAASTVDSASLGSDSQDGAATVRQSEGQTTLLHTAARSGNVRLVQQYIRQGYNINAPDHNGWFPLMCCIHQEGVHLACADALINAGANLDHTGNDDETALHTAAYTGNVSLIELLLLNEANPDVRDNLGRLPLHWATHPPGPKCLKTILKRATLGIDETDDCGMTCLMWAAYNNSPEVVKVLLDRGAEVDEKDVDGLTALHWAIHKEDTRCLRLLLTAERTFYKDRKGCTIMHRAAEHGALGAGTLIHSVRSDAIYDCDKKGRTPLHWAAASSRVDYCAFLLNKGADASQRDYQDMTALDYARDKGFDYVVALMVCDDTAVMDFAKASRSTGVISRLNKSCVESIDSLTNSSPMLSTGTDGAASTALTEEGESGLNSHSVVTLGSLTSAKPGEDLSGYLGLFSQQGKGPLEHHFFWADSSRSYLCWCRDERYKRNHNTSRVLSVHRGPSEVVKCRLDYAPLDTHRHVFHVVLEDSVLDILCYGEKSYNVWLAEVESLAVGNVLAETGSLLESKNCVDVLPNINVTSAEFEV